MGGNTPITNQGKSGYERIIYTTPGREEPVTFMMQKSALDKFLFVTGVQTKGENGESKFKTFDTYSDGSENNWGELSYEADMLITAMREADKSPAFDTHDLNVLQKKDSTELTEYFQEYLQGSSNDLIIDITKNKEEKVPNSHQLQNQFGISAIKAEDGFEYKLSAEMDKFL